MPKRVKEGDAKKHQLGLRVTQAQKERLDALVARIQAMNRRVEASEVYEELMSVREPEFITEADRRTLMGLPEKKGDRPHRICPEHRKVHDQLEEILHSAAPAAANAITMAILAVFHSLRAASGEHGGFRPNGEIPLAADLDHPTESGRRGKRRH